MAVGGDRMVRIVRALQENNLNSLSETDLQYFDICNVADNLIGLYGPGKKTAVMLVATVQERYGESIHITTAYDYINRAQVIFNSRGGVDKKYFRGFIIEELMTLITELRADMYSTGDDEGNGDEKQEANSQPDKKVHKRLKLDPKTVREYREALALLRDTLQLDKDDQTIDPTDDFDTLVITSNPKDAGFEDAVILNSEIEDRLIALGAKKQDDGSWK